MSKLTKLETVALEIVKMTIPEGQYLSTKDRLDIYMYSYQEANNFLNMSEKEFSNNPFNQPDVDVNDIDVIDPIFLSPDSIGKTFCECENPDSLNEMKRGLSNCSKCKKSY